MTSPTKVAKAHIERARHTVRFGTVGTSWITDTFIEAGSQVDGFELAAVHSRELKRAKEFAEKHGNKRAYIDLVYMAGYPEIDAVYIASPNSLHYEHALLFLKNKKHVLVEKPACSTRKEFEQLQAVAKKNGVLLMENMKTLCSPNFQMVAENMHKLGQINRFVGNYGQYSSRYDLLKKKKPEVTNVFNPAFSGGTLMDIGIYPLSAAIGWFGPANVLSAHATMLGSGVDGTITVVLEHEQQKPASKEGGTPQSKASPPITSVILASKTSPSQAPSEIQGDCGTMVIGDIANCRNIKIVYPMGEPEMLECDEAENPLFFPVKHFVELVLAGSKESTTNSLKHTTSVMRALDESRKQAGIRFSNEKEKKEKEK